MKKYFLYLLIFISVSCSNNTDKKTDSIKAGETVEANKGENPMMPEELKEGENIVSYPNGQIKYTGTVFQGKRHGTWIYYYENGIKWSECEYTMGKMDGKTVTFYPNGNPRYIGYYKNDQRFGLWMFYNENGELIKQIEY
jgi:antitoxin component YwqK of YwqJK toxin-antitoxin module